LPRQGSKKKPIKHANSTGEKSGNQSLRNKHAFPTILCDRQSDWGDGNWINITSKLAGNQGEDANYSPDHTNKWSDPRGASKGRSLRDEKPGHVGGQGRINRQRMQGKMNSFNSSPGCRSMVSLLRRRGKWSIKGGKENVRRVQPFTGFQMGGAFRGLHLNETGLLQICPWPPFRRSRGDKKDTKKREDLGRVAR